MPSDIGLCVGLSLVFRADAFAAFAILTEYTVLVFHFAYQTVFARFDFFSTVLPLIYGMYLLRSLSGFVLFNCGQDFPVGLQSDFGVERIFDCVLSNSMPSQFSQSNYFSHFLFHRIRENNFSAFAVLDDPEPSFVVVCNDAEVVTLRPH